MLKKTTILGLGAAILTSAMATSTIAQPEPSNVKITSDRLLAKALQQGGYVIYFRHFQTSADYNDQHTLTIGQCSTQRQLIAKGAEQAIAVRDAFVKAAIPVGSVLSSPFCRAWQSADLAFGHHTVVDGLKLPPSKVYTDANKETMKVALLPLVSTLPEQGKNTILMSHDDNIPTIGGPDVKNQGDAVIFKPLGNNKFEVVAELKAARWAKVARAAQ
jgi:hypothetical protein